MTTKPTIVARCGTWLLLWTVTGCQSTDITFPVIPAPSLPVIAIPSMAPIPVNGAASLSDRVVQPMANALIIAGKGLGQMAGSGSQIARGIGTVQSLGFATQDSLPFPLPTGIPAGFPVAIPSGLLTGPPAGIPSGIPSGTPYAAFWDYRDGWYWSKFNTAERTLKFRFETADGTAADYDLMDPSQYGPPPKRTGLPANVTKFHTEFQNKGPFGTDVAARLYGKLPPAPPVAETRIPQSGTGIVRNVPVLGELTFTVEADANGAGSEMTGVADHRATVDGHVYRALSPLDLNGPTGETSILRDGVAIGVLRPRSGSWELSAEGKVIAVSGL